MGDAQPLLRAAPPLLCLSFGTQRGMRVAGGAAARCPPGQGTLSAGRSRLWTPRLPRRLTSALEPCAPTDPPPLLPADTKRSRNAPLPAVTEVCSVACAIGGWAQRGSPQPRDPHERDGAGIKPSQPSARPSPGLSQAHLSGDHQRANTHQLALTHRRGSHGRSGHRWMGTGQGGGGGRKSHTCE